MTAVAVPDLRDLRAQDYEQRIGGAPTPTDVDTLAELVRDAERMGRITRAHLLSLGAACARRRTALAQGLVLATSQDAGIDCGACGSPMRREVGPWDDPDVRGNVIVDVQDVCPGCGQRWPYLGDEWDSASIRTRVGIVRAHRSVLDHSDCDADQPCRVERPGIPSVPPIGR